MCGVFILFCERVSFTSHPPFINITEKKIFPKFPSGCVFMFFLFHSTIIVLAFLEVLSLRLCRQKFSMFILSWMRTLGCLRNSVVLNCYLYLIVEKWFDDYLWFS